jgi:hypothetical protein
MLGRLGLSIWSRLRKLPHRPDGMSERGIDIEGRRKYNAMNVFIDIRETDFNIRY